VSVRTPSSSCASWRRDSCRLEPVDLRHLDIHKHDTGPKAPRPVDRFTAVRSLAADHDPRLSFEDRAKSSPHERLIVGDQDGDAAFGVVEQGVERHLVKLAVFQRRIILG
jgi:hypothetical protein